MRKFLNSEKLLENAAAEDYNENCNLLTCVVTEENQMKKHKFWAWAMVVCFIMTIYTGYEHK